ncbi:MAG: glycoside hydrolase family 3 C-terminal domain-containing protein [Eubacteriales bacterium]
MNYEKMLKELTLEEKAALVSGTDFMFTNPVPRLNIPSVRTSDGPHGLRVQAEGGDNGVTGSEPATSFPTASCTASGWNPENTYKMGEAIAEEALHYGVDILLGPGMNIKRNPLCGRNFEYFSEDPFLTAKMAGSEVDGVQSKGVGVSLKHFALNNSENYRFLGNSIADMRAIREIYTKAFETVVKKSKPHTVMCAYNRINGTYCSENKWLLKDLLRDEWGFDGAVMTDWGATRDRVAGIKAGLDLEMPGDTDICRKWIIDAVNDGTLAMSDLDEAVKNILRLAQRYENNPECEPNFDKHNELAAEIAEDCAVLLKNDGALPLNKDDKFLVVGDLFEKMRYQGSGSSMINPTKVTSPKDAFEKRGVNFRFVRGYRENTSETDEKLISEAVGASGGFDKILVFAGLTDYIESEGADRENMKLPKNQLDLIEALIKTGKKVVIVLFGGSSAELPFADNVSAILNMYLPGQNGGTATANLLFGDKTPSGKLAETWVNSYEDVPFGDSFGKTVNEVYKESIFVGYRYYTTANKKVRYPFGYGLSYTTFDYRNMKVEKEDGNIKVSCDIVNTGEYDGAEIVQLYVKAPKTVFRAENELKGFTKVYLKAGESKRAEITLDTSDLAYWNVKENRWVIEGGEYEVQLCSDCLTVKLKDTVLIEGEKTASPYTDEISEIYAAVDFEKVTDIVFEKMSGLEIPAIPPKKPITLESRFSDLRLTFMGRILYNAVMGVAKKEMKAAKKLPEGTERDNKIKGAVFLKRILDSNSVRTMSMTSGQSLPYNLAEGFVNLSNGHLIRGIKNFCAKIKVPKLPKYEEEK